MLVANAIAAHFDSVFRAGGLREYKRKRSKNEPVDDADTAESKNHYDVMDTL